MQYLLSVITGSPQFATPEEDADIQVFNDRLKAEGRLVFAGGLPRDATVLDNRNDKGLRTDGPFVESKEFVAGLWIITAGSLDEALDLAAEGSKACNRQIEVRSFFGA